MEQRVNLKFLVKLGKTFTEAYAMVKEVYGNECLSHIQVFEWFKRFREGSETTEDDPRPGRPSMSKADQNIEKTAVRTGRTQLRFLVKITLIGSKKGLPKITEKLMFGQALLEEVYQIAYVIVKSANSPRPGTWILERSIDGENFEPWQYFARSDKECLERFGMPATKGKPHYFTDSEVICTSFYSRLTPMENGEIHTSLVHGRPGANETSPELLDFTRARYVRLRLMGLRGAQEPVPRWLAQDIWKDKRLFYSIRDISIGGQCFINALYSEISLQYYMH
ncbi:hypothetical protein NQ318_008944 [Aromia moschata]|uniref:Laminin N-terminal domain-containing protein n=1 Tax=Aromia moschata TaxID=1265417 RepID=A0AAV8ZAY6_9CUCU|nr:hypothetical protein NQ318_008944 [Aromia moschata]